MSFFIYTAFIGAFTILEDDSFKVGDKREGFNGELYPGLWVSDAFFLVDEWRWSEEGLVFLSSVVLVNFYL